jgi:hypothetical protein
MRAWHESKTAANSDAKGNADAPKWTNFLIRNAQNAPRREGIAEKPPMRPWASSSSSKVRANEDEKEDDPQSSILPV